MMKPIKETVMVSVIMTGCGKILAPFRPYSSYSKSQYLTMCAIYQLPA